MKKYSYDIIIIGGGINGTAIARDAALRGLSVLLLEKKDFGSGTSERSSRLIHGGLRYLEHLHLGLVFESLRERKILLKTAPHLVRPLHFLIPVYKNSTRSLWYITLGLLLYEILSLGKSKAKVMVKNRIIKREPAIEQAELRGGAEYSDAVAHVERLCLAHALDAQKSGAIVENYTEVQDLLKKGNTIIGVRARNKITGKSTTYYAPLVINAAGPWVDNILGHSSLAKKQHVKGTKGTHIILPKKSLGISLQRAIYTQARSDGRPIFVIPLEDTILIGTTDEFTKENIDRVHPTAHEVDYLIDEVNYLFPKARVKRKNVLHAFAGIRPLLYTKNHEPCEIPRKHVIYDHETEGIKGLISIIGGKITTHRKLAEETVTLASKKLKAITFPCITKKKLVYGSVKHFDDYKLKKTAELQKRFRISKEVANHLLDLYGTYAEEVLSTNKSLRKPLCRHTKTIKAQVVYALEKESAKRLCDILVRRTEMVYSHKGIPCYKEAAKLMAKHFGWTRKRMQKEISEFKIEYHSLYSIKKI